MAKRLNSVPWFGKGGSFTARKPMMIGVGDGGNPNGERVTVTPAGRPGNVGGITIHIGKIENHREGDIRRIVLDEFEALARDLEMLGIESDSETMR
jgi:hypothetical protein